MQRKQCAITFSIVIYQWWLISKGFLWSVRPIYAIRPQILHCSCLHTRTVQDFVVASWISSMIVSRLKFELSPLMIYVSENDNWHENVMIQSLVDIYIFFKLKCDKISSEFESNGRRWHSAYLQDKVMTQDFMYMPVRQQHIPRHITR